MENIFRITNYYDHPTNPTYTVFHFFQEERAQTFEELLKESKIPFEKHLDDEGGRKIYLFGVSNIHRKKAVRINFVTIGKYREKFVPYRWMRWALYLFALALISLAIIGYIKSNSAT